MQVRREIEIKINQLTPGLIGELNHYLDYLINKRTISKTRKLKQDWAGELRDVKMTSIELQKAALDWRQK